MKFYNSLKINIINRVKFTGLMLLNIKQENNAPEFNEKNNELWSFAE